MAGAIHTTKPQKLTTVVGVEKNQIEDPNKFYYHFLYKASIVLIFFVILPLFPSQAPDFINQSLLIRNWELLHLLFVGIAISYGLFSRRNVDETDKENNNAKFDSAQSLVSRFLHVSSFFDDESENPSESEETKIQTWSHQHYRNKPVVVLAPQAQSQARHTDFEDHGTGESETEKPLLLPVRSLKSRLSDDADDVVQSVNGAPSCTRSFSLDRSTGSKRFSSNNNSNKARNAEIEGSRLEDKIKEKEKENVVLPSPIPWRSRSARMEPKLEIDNNNNSSTHQQASKTSMEESRPLKSLSQSQSQTYSRSSSRTSSVSSPPLVSSESVAKNTEDLLKKKSFYFKSCYPPPPPPPPPTMFHKSISMKPPRYGSFNEGGANSFDKELKRSFTSERNSRNRNYAENVSMGKSFKPGQNLGSFSGGREIGGEGMDAEGQVEDEEEHARVPLVSEEEEQESFLDKLIVESEDEETETEDEDGGEERINIIQKESGESPPHVEESSKTEIGTSSSGTVGDETEGPDVDKKADEFIAKFREQIRLQRIESIKRSATRIARNSSR